MCKAGYEWIGVHSEFMLFFDHGGRQLLYTPPEVWKFPQGTGHYLQDQKTPTRIWHVTSFSQFTRQTIRQVMAVNQVMGRSQGNQNVVTWHLCCILPRNKAKDGSQKVSDKADYLERGRKGIRLWKKDSVLKLRRFLEQDGLVTGKYGRSPGFRL